MRIAIYSDTCFYPQVNGVANAVKQSALALSELGHEVCLFTVSPEDEKRLEKMVGNKFKICLLPSLPFIGYKGERMSLSPVISLRRLKKFKPDVIHVHTPFVVGWEGVACAKILKVPLVGTHHTFYDHYLDHVKLNYEWAKNMSWKYTIRFYNRCDLVLNPSQALNNELIKAGLKKPNAVLANPIDTDFFRPLEVANLKSKSENSIIYMGRLSYEKSIDQVVRAFEVVAKEMPETRLTIVGDGPEKEKLNELARELGVEDKIAFTGYLFGEDLLHALQANDIFVTASLSENQPVSVLEAMATGLPVVACRAAGMPEVVRDSENGFLTAPDNINEMAQKIIMLLKNPELKKKFSRTSREMANNYSDKSIASTLVVNYEKLKQKKQFFKVFLYLEFYKFLGGLFYKKIGTGLLSSYKNQKSILECSGIEYKEEWFKDFEILQINTPWFWSLHLIKKAKKLGKKVVIWSHVTPEDAREVFWFNKIIFPLIKKYLIYAYNQADLIFCPSEYTKGLLVKHGIAPEKMMAMSNGVDLEKYYQDEKKRKKGRAAYCLDKVTVGTVGLIIPRKGVDTFLKMAGEFPGNKFFWVGKKYSSFLVKPLPKNLPANCIFTGFVDDVLAAFNAMDIFIFPSYEENEGMVILEAAALGLPLLVRDIPVYEGWLEHGVNCLKAKNDEEFKTYLNQLINNEELRKKLGHSALAVAKAKSKTVMAEKVCAAYNRLLEKKMK